MSETKHLDVTIGILTWNSKELLRNLLDSIHHEKYRSKCEIIVVDNHSTDGTLEMMKSEYPEVVLIENKTNKGVAPARNQVFRAAKGRYTIHLDVDTCILPRSIDVLVESMDRYPKAAIGGSKLIYGDGRLQLSCRPFPSPLNILIEGTFLRKYFPNSRYVKDYTMEDWDHGELREVDWMYGACLIFRTETLEKIGLFDEGFFYLYEDIDLCYQARKKGFQVLYIPESTVIHYLAREEKPIFHRHIKVHIRSILRYLFKDYYGFGRNGVHGK